MVCVYIANVSKLQDPKDFPDIMEGLSEARKQKILRYRVQDVRVQSLGASLLLKHVLHLHGASLEEIHYGEHGKPELDHLYFNLSHSHDIAVCVVSENSVGCDVEQIATAPWRIAERYFCKKELEHLETFQGEEKNSEFFRLWTLKESYMKMTGEGLSLGLNYIEFVFDKEIKVLRDGKICDCYFKEYELPGYKFTVCAKEQEFAKEPVMVKL